MKAEALVADVNVWKDVLVPLVVAAIAFVASGIAILWPWLQALQRGRKFQRLIRRELEEIGPFPPEPEDKKPWWERITRRFVHEELFRQDAISANRDFLLSLNPTVVYQVSQLWSALEKRDGRQWRYFLEQLAHNRRVTSKSLVQARDQWGSVLKKQPHDWLDPVGTSSFRQQAALARVPPLFEKRLDAYARLLPLTDYGSEGNPNALDERQRKDLFDSMRLWYYKDGAGLLLSGRALEQFRKVLAALRADDNQPQNVRDAFSRLRTDLKIDLGVRQPGERDVTMSWPEDERW